MTLRVQKRVIPTSELTLDDVPPKLRRWADVSEFALTFDPLTENLTQEQVRDMRNLPPDSTDLKSLRGRLYTLQRIYNQQSTEVPEHALAEARTLVDRIRSVLTGDNAAPVGAAS